MKLKMKRGTSSTRIKLFVQDSTGAGKTGVLSNHVRFVYIRDVDSSAALTSLNSNGSVGSYTSQSWTEVSATNMPGVYEFGVPSHALSSYHVLMMFTANGSTATGMLPILVEIELDEIDYRSDSYSKLEASADTIVSGSAVSGTLSTTEMTTNLPSTVDDHYNGRVLIITNGSSTTGLLYQATNITDYDGTTKKLTFTALSAAPSSSTTFIIV